VIEYAYLDSLQIAGGTNGIDLVSVEGLGGSPQPRTDHLEKPRGHGAVDRTQFYAGRTIELTGEVWGATPTAIYTTVDLLKKQLALGSDHILKFRREGFGQDERVTVRVADEVDVVIDLARRIKWGVQLFAADPRLYGDTLKSSFYDPTVVGLGGIDFPLDFPLVFGQSTSGQMTVENQGNFPTPPVLTIEGPVTNPKVDNETVGKTIDLTGTFVQADDVVIDVGSRRVTLNGAVRPDLIVVSTTAWWEIVPGDNTLRLRGSSMAGGQTRLTVAFRDARI
jgi:hypothetical protein